MTVAAPAEHETPTRPRARDLDDAGRRLQGWLRDSIDPALTVAGVRMPGASGVANETLLVETSAGTIVVRVDSAEHLFMGTDLARHYRLYEAMAGVVPVPAMLGFEADPALLGQRFFAMAHVAGQVPPDRPNFNEAGWVVDLDPGARRTLWLNAISTMARLNTVEPARVGFLARPADGASGLAQELRHWLDYARWCGADREPIVAAAADWLVAHFPDDPPTEFSWGDARLQNLIFDGTEVAAVLDWDMASLAGGEADLAWYAITDQVHTAARGAPRLVGLGTPAEAIALWEDAAGRRVRSMDWHCRFAAYRSAAVMIRLAKMLRGAGLLQPSAEYLLTNNTGIQMLSMLLDLPPAGPITTPWVGLDK